MTIIGQVVTSTIEQDKEKRELGEAEVQSFIKDGRGKTFGCLDRVLED